MGPRSHSRGDSIARWLAKHRGLWGLLIVVVATLTTALVGLIVEDVVSANGDVSHCSAGVILGSAIGLVLLVLLVLARTKATDDYGTLYYVRLLARDMADWRQTDLAADERGYLDVRIITRSFNPNERAGGIDISDVVTEQVRTIQAEMNSDRVDSGFTVAPNMLLPAGIAFGSGFYWWTGTYMVEFATGVQLRWRQSKEWPALPASPRGAEVQIIRDGEAIESSHTSGAFPVDEDAANSDPTRVMLLKAFLTDNVMFSDPPCRVSETFAVGVPDEPGDWRRVNVVDQPGGAVDSSGVAQVAAVTASIMTARMIRLALHRADTGQVVLALKVPKTVAVAAGWLLINGRRSNPVTDPGCGDPTCKRPGCWRPWEHLVTPYWDQARRAWMLARVHPDQPDLATMAKRVDWTIAAAPPEEN
jgi:hypothetical protein